MPNRNLQTIAPIIDDMQPVVFQGSSITPQQADTNLLARSLASLEARQEKAATQQQFVDKTLAEIESKLHNDEETRGWFNDYKRQITDKINEEIEVGDYGQAIRIATKEAGNVLKDSEVIGKLQANADFEEDLKTQKARRDRGDISQNTYNWYVANNKYKDKVIKDADGNVTNVELVKTMPAPVKDIKLDEIAERAFKLITPYKNTVSDKTSKTTTNQEGKQVVTDAGSTTASHDVTRITKQEILDNIKDLMPAGADGFRQVEQLYDVQMFEYDQMKDDYATKEKQLADLKANGCSEENITELENELGVAKAKIKNREQLLFKNGSPLKGEDGYKEFYARAITDNAFAKGLAYNWRNDSTAKVDRDSKTERGTGSDNKKTTSSNPFPAKPTAKGPLIEDNPSNTNNVDYSTNGKAKKAAKTVLDF